MKAIPKQLNRTLLLPPLSVYVHIPWCVRKCPYCDFNSHVKPQALPEREYLTALSKDLDADRAYLFNRSIKSVFIGGGTPSLFESDSIAKLLDILDERVSLSSDVEITLEANPGTFESDKFRRFFDAGVNRLSIGVQSFDDSFLKTLGRIHSSAEAKKAIEIAFDAGFENINLDLMYGLPGQDVEQALTDLEQACAFSPQHLSWYQLTLEPNTAFYSKPPTLPHSDQLEAIQDCGLEYLARNGFDRYEVSAFAHSGKRSIHNENYWLFGDYLGIGAGAHGKLTVPGEDKIIRARKLRQPNAYLGGTVTYAAESKNVSVEERALEFLMNALRLRDGFPIPLFEQRTGVAFDNITKQLESLHKKGLVELGENRVRASTKGFHLLDSILQEFL